MNGSLYVSSCPLMNCHWDSDPHDSADAASEAFRAHLAGHAHSDLVLHIHLNSMLLTQYAKTPRSE